MVKKVYESKRITLPEALEYLKERIDVDEEEVSYYQRIALEHAQAFSRTTAEQSRQIVEMLIEDFRISELGAISVANILPNTIDELRAVLGSEGRPMTTETLYKILNAISEIISPAEEAEEEAAASEESEEPPADGTE